MDCPYCGRELTEGIIYGGNCGIHKSLRWLPADKKPTLAAMELESEILGSNKILEQPKVKAYKCAFCKKMIIDLDE